MTPPGLFGAALRECRHAAGRSQDELAQAIRYHKSYIGHLEHGRRFPSEELTAQIDTFLHANNLLVDLRRHLAAVTNDEASALGCPIALRTGRHSKIQQAIASLASALTPEEIEQPEPRIVKSDSAPGTATNACRHQT